MGNKRTTDKFAVKDCWRVERKWRLVHDWMIDGRVGGIGQRGGSVGERRRSGNVCRLAVIYKIFKEARWSEKM